MKTIGPPPDGGHNALRARGRHKASRPWGRTQGHPGGPLKLIFSSASRFLFCKMRASSVRGSCSGQVVENVGQDFLSIREGEYVGRGVGPATRIAKTCIF